MSRAPAGGPPPPRATRAPLEVARDWLRSQLEDSPALEDDSELGSRFIDKLNRGETELTDLPSQPAAIASGVLYDVMGAPPDWGTGYSTIFIGVREPGTPRDRFLASMSEHVSEVRAAFESRGLRGYTIMATPDFEIAFQNWDSEAAATAAMTSEAGQAVVADADTLMSFDVFEPIGWASSPRTP
jgi:hypothetical protein